MQEFLRKEQGIKRVPCYDRFLCLLKLVKPGSLNRCVKEWAERLLSADRKTVSVALDGKTIRSTGKMGSYESPLHIISAQLCEMGITLASRSTEGKSNEIPAVQELLKELDISGCLVVADALNCQKKMAKAVIDGKGDYLLSVKGDQADIEDYAQDDSLRKSMDTGVRKEKTGAESKRGRHLLRMILHGFLAGRNGPGCAALARFIRNLRKRAEKPVNGITISPAEN